MLQRQYFIANHVEAEYAACLDPDLDRLLWSFFSRAQPQTDKELKKMAETIVTKMIKFDRIESIKLVYISLVHNLKKILRSLHDMLGLTEQVAQKQPLHLKKYEDAKVFYLNFLNVVIEYFIVHKNNFKVLKEQLDRLYTPNFPEAAPINHYRTLKNFFVLFVLYDPFIYKFVNSYKDQIFEDIQSVLVNGGELNDEDCEQQCFQENLQNDILDDMAAFRAGQKLQRRWVQWYKYLYDIGFFKVASDPLAQAKNLKPATLVCCLEGYNTEDSDEDRQKYQIFEDEDIIEEGDEEDDCFDELVISREASCELGHEEQKLWKKPIEEVMDYIDGQKK